MSFDNAVGIIPPVLGLAIAGYAVKTVGKMMHATCKHCGHTVKAKDHETLHLKARTHSREHNSSYHTYLAGW